MEPESKRPRTSTLLKDELRLQLGKSVERAIRFEQLSKESEAKYLEAVKEIAVLRSEKEKLVQCCQQLVQTITKESQSSDGGDMKPPLPPVKKDVSTQTENDAREFLVSKFLYP